MTLPAISPSPRASHLGLRWASGRLHSRGRCTACAGPLAWPLMIEEGVELVLDELRQIGACLPATASRRFGRPSRSVGSTRNCRESFAYRTRGDITSSICVGAPRPPGKRLSALCRRRDRAPHARDPRLATRRRTDDGQCGTTCVTHRCLTLPCTCTRMISAGRSRSVERSKRRRRERLRLAERVNLREKYDYPFSGRPPGDERRIPDVDIRTFGNKHVSFAVDDQDVPLRQQRLPARRGRQSD